MSAQPAPAAVSMEGDPGMGEDPKLEIRLDEPDPEEESQSKWKCMPCRDVLFALLWLASYFSVLVFLGMYQEDHKYLDLQQSGDAMGKYLAIACGLAFSWCLVWILMMWMCARCLLWFGILSCATLQALGAVWCFSIGFWVAGALFTGLTITTILWALCMRSRIALAGKMVEIAASVLFQNPFLFPAALLSQLSMLCFAATLIVATLGTCGHFHHEDDDSTAWGMLFYFVFVGFWMMEVCKNVIHVTSCAVLGEWYFHNNVMATFPALLRACTVHLGSIAFGSLFVAIVETLRFLAYWVKKETEACCGGDNCCVNCIRSFLFCCVDCCLGCVQRCIEFCNAYAYVHVAIYGFGYCEAAKSAYYFLEESGMTAVLQDDIVSTFMIAGALFGGLFTGLFTASIANENDDWNADQSMTWGFVIGLLAIFFIHNMLSPLKSAVQALLVCFAEDPIPLHTNHPEVFAELLEHWKQVYGDEDIAGEEASEGEGAKKGMHDCLKHAQEKIASAKISGGTMTV